MMTAEESPFVGLTLLSLTCGRIVSLTSAVLEAHSLGVTEGSHEDMTSADYHQEAVKIFGGSLPWSYQRRIASLFSRAADALDELTIPMLLAEDCLIVDSYLRNACTAIDSWLETHPRAADTPEPPELTGMYAHTPMVVHFDELAKLVTHDGACRLQGAANAVQHYLDSSSVLALTDDQKKLLKGLASGARIADLARQLGYSRSSIYRQMSKLWEALNVADRNQAIREASKQGLLD